MASGQVFAIIHAAFLALWVGSMMFVFQTLHMPLVTTPYETRPTGIVSEDFLSLRDPFMFPTRGSPSGTLLHFPALGSQHSSADMATITGISRAKSTTSLPVLKNERTTPNVGEASQEKRTVETKSRQRRVNSEPMLPLARLQMRSPTAQERPHFLGSGESVDIHLWNHLSCSIKPRVA
ncbi:hypothetical protein JB92DRAFT_2901665 [Gautieria morchelliformis]|nr:hypothetical protein JB92DRAFT_2901665 [Gautieria morchelliformis]